MFRSLQTIKTTHGTAQKRTKATSIYYLYILYIKTVEPAYTITSTAKDSIVIEQDANILKFINEIKGLFILNL